MYQTYYPTKQEFLEGAKSYNLIPVYRELVTDLETPISIYKKVCPNEKALLLESVEGGESVARYSFIGIKPFMEFKTRGDSLEIMEGDERRQVSGNPLSILKDLMGRFKVPPTPGLPRFYGGAVGYLGYDLVRFIERLPNCPEDDVKLADSHLIFPKIVIIFDHVKHTIRVVSNTLTAEGYDLAIAEIDTIIEKIRNGTTASTGDTRGSTIRNSARGFEPRSNLERETFLAMVGRAKEHIKAGDIFQVVLSQRLEAEVQAEPFEVYRVLRTVNPSPYMYFLNFGEVAVAGSSPELLVRVENGLVETRPIAGTRRRGETPEADLLLEKELLADEKERAEHVMLVDLGRNDLGRVCKYGTVRVRNFMSVERYSHVMHIVSDVQGELAPGKNAFDALAACFPAGTVSGAPKVRAMEIIDDLEPTKRGPYAGAVGYFGFSGNMDTCITIRTIVISGGKAYVQAGAGIVADSQPESEYAETLNKARALLQTLEIAEGESR